MADGQPYIPGSSFKGNFRSTVEKLAATVGLQSCGLMEGQGCPGAQGREQKLFNALRREEGWDEETLLHYLTNGKNLNSQMVRLCDTCWLFGSPYTASKSGFSDLYLVEDIVGIVQVRDGVAIDRDSEKQVPGLLYNYEVVVPTLAFGMEILLEDPTDTDLQLTCLGVSEFLSGFGRLGGKRSQGLGRCNLTNLKIYQFDLTIEDTDERAKRLRKYLLGKTPEEKMTSVADVTGFINTQIETLLA
jgi:CRISPR-associated RAMP protein (TIGR02581 family)